MNRVLLIGELTNEVEVQRHRRSGPAWAKTTIAVTRGTKGAIDFVPVVLRDREAVQASRYLGGGSLIAVEGHVHSAVTPVRDDDDLHTRRLVWVIADRVFYLRLPRVVAGARA